jgi:hypothetical protein
MSTYSLPILNMLTSIFSMLIPNKKTAQVSWISAFGLVFMVLNHSTAIAAEKQEVYKLRLGVNSSIGSADMWSLNGSEANEEWVVINVQDKKKFKIYHTTYLENKTWRTRQWFDHPVTAMKICLTDGFEKKDCKVVNSDTATIPRGTTIHNLSIDFKYSESGRSFTKNIVISPDAKPE